MDEKYQGKYRIPSARAQWWDYGNNGAYFITICAVNKEPYFGYIIDNSMNLSTVGKITERIWYEIVNHAKNIKLGEFVVMPNHIHGILTINNPENASDDIDDVGVDDVGVDDVGVDDVGVDDVETRHALSLQSQQPLHIQNNPNSKTPGQSRFRNPGKNTVSSIIGGFKSAITRECNKLSLDFAWQSRFYDNIIRNNEEYNRISNYIIYNPINWKKDKFYKE